MEYIQWLSLNDFALGIQLKRMNEILNAFTEEKEYTNVNEVMELYVVCKYMDAKIYPSIWDKIIVDKNVETTKRFKRNHLYFPKELTVDDKKQIIEKYIDCADANLNYLQIIVNIQDNPDTLSIGDKARLKARKRVDEEQKELFSDGGNFKTEINVVFAELKENDSEFDMDPRKIVCKYNSNWIKENLDEPTLLKDFCLCVRDMHILQDILPTR